MAATEPLPLSQPPAGGGFFRDACVLRLFAPGSLLLSPRLHFVRGRWGRWEQIHFRVGKRGGGGEKGSLPGGGRAGRDKAGVEVAEDLLLEPLGPGRKGARESGSVAEMTCGPEWEGEPGKRGVGAGLQGRGALEEGPEGVRGPGGGA